MYRLLFFLAVIPVVILLTYIYIKDNHKEPKNLLLKVFLLGFLSIIPVGIVEIIIDKYIQSDNYVTNKVLYFIFTFINIGLIEEFFKWLIIKRKVYNSKEFDETYDAIVYAVFASLGFACLENILYVVSENITVGVLRGITAVPSHCCDAIFMGYFFIKAKTNTNEKKYLFLSFIVPVIIHTIYDYLLLEGSFIGFIFWIIFHIVTFIVSMKIVKNEALNNKQIN